MACNSDTMRTLVTASAVLWLAACLSGCNPAELGFAAVELGEALPSAARLPEGARRTAFGVAWGGREGPVGAVAELTQAKSYSFRALVDDAGKVVAKSYSSHEWHGYGWLLAEEHRLVLEVQVPKAWCRNGGGVAPGWDGPEALRCLSAAWPEIKGRIRWGPSPTSGPAGDERTDAGATAIRSTGQLLEALEPCLLGPSQRDRKPRRSVPLYVLMVWAAMKEMPFDAPRQGQEWMNSAADVSPILRAPGAFVDPRLEGYRWTRETVENYFITKVSLAITNIGHSTVRLECRVSKADGPFLARPTPRGAAK